MRRTTSALAAAPDAHGSVAAGVGKISKTTPCKAAGVPPALGKALDTSGNSVAHFHYSEIAQPPAAAQWLAHLAEGQIDPLAAEHAVLAVGKRRHTVIK